MTSNSQPSRGVPEHCTKVEFADQHTGLPDFDLVGLVQKNRLKMKN